jgi:hypothetical protein
MRAAQALSAIFVLCLMAYVATQYAAVTDALQPDKPHKEPPPKPLEEAAPEVAALRPGLRQLAKEALAQVPLCVNRNEEHDPPRPRGRVLIWDVEQDDVSQAHGCLPLERRLTSVDDPCTVYLITERERTYVLDYNYDFFHGGGASGVKGYRTDLVVCAVDLPSRQPRGRYRISGHGPPTIVELKPAVKEIDENWAGNLKHWIDICTTGGEAQHVPSHKQPLYRQADAARAVIGECELLGSLPTLGNFPRKANIYNLQMDRCHTADGFIHNRAQDDSESRLLVLPLDETLVVDPQNRFGRFSWRVALVAFPNAEPLGVYQVQGESWPIPKRAGETWAGEPTTNKDLRDPNRALARWVEDLCKVKTGVPRGTLAVSLDAEPLAGTDWLKGPGWLKRVKRPPLPASQQGWERLAEECSAKVEECRALGAAAPPSSLPKKVVVWTDHSESFVPSYVQQKLPAALQAGASERDVLMILIVGQHYVQLPKGSAKPKTDRWDYELALFTMPGARPMGMYRAQGEALPVDRPRMGKGARNHDVNRDVADWVTRFMASPDSVAAE